MTATVPKSTAQMLQEIEIGLASTIILESRAVNHPFGPTYVDRLDDALARARPHSGGSRLERGDLVEVTGASGSGKTTLLLFLLMGSLLPTTFTLHYPNPHPINLGGRSQNASLLLIATHRSPLPVLAKRIREYIINAITAEVGQITMKPELEEQVDKVVTECLGRLRIVRVKPRWKTWSLALKSLLRPLTETEGDDGAIGEGMDLVICDGFGDAFWPERWADESSKARGRSRTGIGRVRGNEDIGLHDVMQDIGRLRKEMGSVVILSVQGLWGPGPFFSTHLPPPYPNPFSSESDNPTIPTTPSSYPLNIQISLQGRIKPLQEPADRTLIEALHIRDRTLERGSRKFEGWVRVVNGQHEVGSKGGTRFEFSVGGQGIHPWEDVLPSR